MAIVSPQSKIPAMVAAFGRIKESQYQSGRQIQSVLFEGDGIKHWATFPTDEARQFCKGQQVNLIPTRRGDRQSYDIEPVTSSSPLQLTQSTSKKPLETAQENPEQERIRKQAIAAFITDQSRLWAFCHGEATRSLPDGIDAETIRCCAASLFISANRKFRIES